MFLEPIRIVTNWLSHATYGVNAKLDAFVVGDLIQDEERPPAIVTIEDMTRDIRVVTFEPPLDFPAIYVTIDTPIIVEGRTQTDSFRNADDVFIALRYFARNADHLQMMQDTFYTLRAINHSLRELAKNANVANRTFNQVCMMLKDITYPPVNEKVGDAVVTGAAVSSWTYRDTFS